MRPTATLRALWDVLWGTCAPLPSATDTVRGQFDKEYDALLVEMAVSLEAPRAARSHLRRVA